MNLISDLNIDVTFIDIGSNDLCNYHIAPETVAYQIIAFSEDVLSKDCKAISLSEILPRTFPPDNNDRVEKANKKNQQMIFWAHSRNNFNNPR